MKNAINWFELPATNFERAKGFYSKVMGADLQKVEFGDVTMAFFPTENKGVGGCVIHGNGVAPSAEGSLVYLNGGDDLAAPLSRVETAGGSVVQPKTDIGENGFMAVFIDSEGNKVAFHSWN
ncbi:MAG: VOC family protein [Saprospiraceae bacterium]|nr:VOC family protein [Saprospiraceae bacterium]